MLWRDGKGRTCQTSDLIQQKQNHKFQSRPNVCWNLYNNGLKLFYVWQSKDILIMHIIPKNSSRESSKRANEYLIWIPILQIIFPKTIFDSTGSKYETCIFNNCAFLWLYLLGRLLLQQEYNNCNQRNTSTNSTKTNDSTGKMSLI